MNRQVGGRYSSVHPPGHRLKRPASSNGPKTALWLVLVRAPSRSPLRTNRIRFASRAAPLSRIQSCLLPSALRKTLLSRNQVPRRSVVPECKSTASAAAPAGMVTTRNVLRTKTPSGTSYIRLSHFFRHVRLVRPQVASTPSLEIYGTHARTRTRILQHLPSARGPSNTISRRILG